jgi:hypothetical protein
MQRIPNPRYAGSPSRMQDGRLFTDYRSNCKLLPEDMEVGGSFEDKEKLQRDGPKRIQADRDWTSTRAISTGCVDTMVPESSKRACSWNGCVTLPTYDVGIGQGRLYLPERTDLVDPDQLAAATAFTFGTFPVRARPANATLATAVLPSIRNRYSAPYA